VVCRECPQSKRPHRKNLLARPECCSDLSEMIGVLLLPGLAQNPSAGVLAGCPEGLQTLRDLARPQIPPRRAACEKCRLVALGWREPEGHGD
jgi:hypothetical protein